MIKKRLQIIIVLSFFVGRISFAQTADSAKSVIFFDTNESIESRISAGIDVTKAWLRKDNSYALKIAEEVKELSLQQENRSYQVKGFLVYGEALEWSQEYKSAKSNYAKANKIASDHSIDSLNVNALSGLAHAHYMLFELDSAAARYIEAVKLVELGNDLAKKAEVYVLLAEYNRSIPRFDLAIEYLDKAMFLVKKGVVHRATEIEMYSRYAAVWNETGVKTDSAIYYSERCIEFGESMNDLHVVATSHNELASIKKKANNPAYIQHIFKAIEIWKNMNYLAYEGRAILNMIRYTSGTPDYQNLQNIELLEDFLRRSEDKALPLLKQEVYHLLSAEYETSGNIKKALETLKIFTKFAHENSSKEQQNALNEAQEKYEAEKHLRTISEQEYNLKIANDEKMREREMRLTKEAESRNYLILSVALLLVLATVIYLIVRSRNQNQKLKYEEEKTKKANNQLESALNEKELLLKEIHHRVKNNLQIVVGLLELQSNRMELEPVKKALLESINRVRSMSLVHQKLYMGADIGKVDLNDYILSLLREIELSNNKGPKALIKELKIPELTFDTDSIIPIGLIITELLTNSFKYAFNKNEPFISIQIEVVDKKYRLTYKDNGPGLPTDFEISKSRSLGMRLIQQLSRQLNGEVRYSYDNGATFLIIFEDSEARKQIA